MSAQHRIVEDRAGWGAWPRLTCYGHACNGATIVRAPHDDAARWAAREAEFVREHGSRRLDLGRVACSDCGALVPSASAWPATQESGGEPCLTWTT